MVQKNNLVCFPDIYGAVTQKLFSENQGDPSIACQRYIFSCKDIRKKNKKKTFQGTAGIC